MNWLTSVNVCLSVAYRDSDPESESDIQNIFFKSEALKIIKATIAFNESTSGFNVS